MENTAGASINYSQDQAQSAINDLKNGEANGCGSMYHLRLPAMTILTTWQIMQRRSAAAIISRSTLRAAFMSVVVVGRHQSLSFMARTTMDQFLTAADQSIQAADSNSIRRLWRRLYGALANICASWLMASLWVLKVHMR